ncbi:LysR family transcriptional regulator [Microbacterium sp. cx-55]|uniref:LysR family transcriptional regulator n=1 Tax=Microbacterium sp. cx-55 TaxID=2875948 RepID=UPI001CBBBEFB|nr:LysR family transcriptional regulator [Microbacterium sp. cx-55]MBZ4488389.1 LysR family transcriptional regulator [Microbacterium sp. cx-55]UGB35041.1 LysR family transcriptional regulator [Microbacterium sp. cx-55]
MPEGPLELRRAARSGIAPVDLNLIRAFVAIAETRSLTSAAGRLYVTQPAVSQALGRLRRELDDPLFHRVGRAMVPTPLADSVYPGFREAVAAVDRTLDGVRRFDPADSTRTFRIALSELGEIGWFPAIVRAVRRRAPEMRIEVVPMDVQALPEWLGRGTVDLAATPSPVPGRFEKVILKTQGYGVVMSSRHPLSHSPLDLEAYATAGHIVVASDSGAPAVEHALRLAGVTIEPRIAAHHFAALPPLLAASHDLIATMPDTIAEGWAQTWPLVVRPLPFEMAPLDVSLYRRSTTAHTAALDWLFETVARAIRGSSGRFQVIHGDAADG